MTPLPVTHLLGCQSGTGRLDTAAPARPGQRPQVTATSCPRLPSGANFMSRLPAQPGNRSHSLGYGDGQCPRPSVTGLSPARRHRTGPHYRRPEEISDLDVSRRASRQLPPERRRNHLVSHLTPDLEVEIETQKLGLSWSPVTESNRRPSPYHACGFRPTASRWVALRHVRQMVLSGWVWLGLPRPGGVVTWLVTGSRTDSSTSPTRTDLYAPFVAGSGGVQSRFCQRTAFARLLCCQALGGPRGSLPVAARPAGRRRGLSR